MMGKRCFTAVMVSVLAVLMMFVPSYAKDRKVVRVGYYEDGDYMYQNHSGVYEGFNFEYLDELAKYTGWSYEVVDTGSWEQAFRKLENSEIDILPSVFYTRERAEEIRYASLPTALPICSIYTTLNVRQDDTRYAYADYEAFGSMKVGVLEGSKDAGNFLEYCEKHGIQPEIHPYKNTPDLVQALDEGSLDAIAITHLGRKQIFRSVAQFAPEPLYIGVAPDKQALLEELNDSMEALRIRNPQYEARLYSKYFSVASNQKPVFTRDELDYIKQADTLKVLYNPSWPPLESSDPDSGEFSGIASGIFDDITAMTGLQFEFVPSMDDFQSKKLLQEGGVLIDAMISGDYIGNQLANINTTEYYLNSPMVLIKNGNGDIRTMAVVKDTLMSDRLEEDHPELDFVYYKTLKECFEALKKKKADAIFTNTYSAEYYLSRPAYQKFSIAMMTDYAEEFSIGVSRKVDLRLYSILDKCIQYTSLERINKIILENSIAPQVVTWQDFILQNPVYAMGGILIVFSIITLVLLYALVSKSRSSRRIQKLMYLDELTGIWNLSKFRIEAANQLKEQKPGSTVLFYSDIKQFKTINDTMGFEEGDQLLCMYAKVLRGILKPGEYCARVSADQFVMLFHYTDWEQILARTAEIEDELHRQLQAMGKKYFVILCFGAYIITDTDKNISWMLDLANYARRSIKTTHKSMTVLFDEDMRQQELLNRDLSDQMGRAIRNEEFVCYLQPKVNMATRELIGSEALVRWNHPERGLLYPGAFIPFFEENGFVVEIDWYIYEEVCRLIQTWIRAGKKVMPVSCNFSRLHFKNETFPSRLIRIADQYQVPYSFLELEMTEGMLMENPELVIRMFTELKAKGFVITIDDFGTGYSSLGLLQKMPVDVIKLDRSFLTDNLRGNREQKIIHNIVNLADDLHIEVICEGIETKNQAESLMRLGCYRAQGFYYARPVPVPEFETMMDENKL